MPPETSCAVTPPTAIESAGAETRPRYSEVVREIAAIPRGFGRSRLAKPNRRRRVRESIGAPASVYLCWRVERFGLLGIPNSEARMTLPADCLTLCLGTRFRDKLDKADAGSIPAASTISKAKLSSCRRSCGSPKTRIRAPEPVRIQGFAREAAGGGTERRLRLRLFAPGRAMPALTAQISARSTPSSCAPSLGPSSGSDRSRSIRCADELATVFRAEDGVLVARSRISHSTARSKPAES